VGGPIKKDKVFFFVSYQGTNQANGVSSSSNKTTFLPVLGNRAAQALGAIYGGQAGVFGGVAVAPDGSNINPVALALLNAKLPDGHYAIPSACVLTTASSGYCALSAPAFFNEKQVIAGGDVNITSKQRLSLKTLHSRDPTQLPFEGSTNVLGFGESDCHANTNLFLSYTYTLTPTLVNEIRVGYLKNIDQQLPQTPITSAELGMQQAVLPDMPSILIANGFDVGAGRNENQIIRQTEFEVDDTLSKQLGRHSLRFGGTFNPVRVLYSDLFVQRGELQIQSIPDFLLGMNSAENGTPYSNLAQTLVGDGRPATYPNTNNFDLFAQDDFRVTDRLTLNLGMRYQFNGQASYGDGRMSNWDYRLYPKGVPPAGGTLDGPVLPANVPSDITIPPGVTKLDHDTLIDSQNWLGFSPRVGLAWAPVKSAPNLLLRLGYGMFWSAVAGTYSIGTSAGEPFYGSVLAGGASNPTVTLQNPYPSVPPIIAFPLYQPITLGSNPTVYPYDPLMKQPHAQTYSGNLQYEVKSVLFTAGYVGSQRTNLVGFVAPNQAGLAKPQNPINGQTTSTLANLLLRVPYVGFAPGIDSIGEFMNTYCASEQACSASPYSGKPYWSRYNSFQLSASKRYSDGLTFIGAYTWSRAIENLNGSTTGRQQSLGTAVGNYWSPLVGPSNFIRTNIFTGSYLYQIPKVSALTGPLNMIVNGWALCGVVIIESGLPYSITDSRGGTIYGVGGSGSSSYAEFAPGMGPGNVPISNPTLTHYFNTSVFAPPPTIGDGTGFGNPPKNFMTGPGFWNTDFAVSKPFAVREPLTVEFRAELFNLFNHPNFANPSSNVGSPGSFGVISSRVSSPRIAQFAVKLRF
jgi:hypothetical protein